MNAREISRIEKRLGLAKQVLIVSLLLASLVTSCTNRQTTHDVIGEIIQLEAVVCEQQDKINAVYNANTNVSVPTQQTETSNE